MKFRLPGLHSLHWKVFAFHLAVLVLPVGYLAWELRRSLETTHLQATEEGMIDTAAMAGDIYAGSRRKLATILRKPPRGWLGTWRILKATVRRRHGSLVSPPKKPIPA